MIKDLKYEIDLQNVFFCITVLVIHLLSGPIAELDYGGFWHTVCFYIQRPMFFAVYGFIFLSGQKSFLSTKKEKVSDYYKKRFKTIVIPYIIAVLATWMFFYRQDGILALFKFLLNGRAGAQFYFVIVIVQFYILLPLLKVVMKRVSPKIMLVVAFVINIIAVFLLSDTEYCELILLRYIFCYILGAVAGGYYDRFNQMVLSNKLKIVIFFFVMVICELLGVRAYLRGEIIYPVQQIITMIYMPAAILFFLMLALLVSRHNIIKFDRVLKAINANSYYIFLWHVLVLTLTEWHMKGRGITRVSHLFIGKTFALIILIVCIVLIRWIFSKCLNLPRKHIK